MKKFLLALTVVSAMASISVASVYHYRDYQTKETAKSVAMTDAKIELLADQVQAVKAESDKTLTENTRLQTECEKGKVAYEKLTPIAKTQTPVPNCTPVQ